MMSWCGRVTVPRIHDASVAEMRRIERRRRIDRVGESHASTKGIRNLNLAKLAIFKRAAGTVGEAISLFARSLFKENW